MGLKNIKRSNKVLHSNPNKQDEGNIIQTPNNRPMSLFDSAKLALVTLHANQFVFPSKFLVHDVRQVELKKIDAQTGFQQKDSNGKAIGTGAHVIRLQLVDGDLAIEAFKRGNTLDGLSTVQCTIMQDIPEQTFEVDDTLITLVKPNVMLAFDGSGFTRLVLKAEGYKEVDVSDD